MRFSRRLDEHKRADGVLATVNDLLSSQGLLRREGSAVDATLIAAPSSSKNKDKQRDPEMHSSKEAAQRYFGMKAHFGVDAKPGVHWPRRPGKRMELDKDNNPIGEPIDKEEKRKAGIGAKVEHPFRIIKRPFGFVKVRCRGLKKNTLQIKTLFGLFPPVDDQAQADGSASMSASTKMVIAQNRGKDAQTQPEKWLERPELKTARFI